MTARKPRRRRRSVPPPLCIHPRMFDDEPLPAYLDSEELLRTRLNQLLNDDTSPRDLFPCLRDRTQSSLLKSDGEDAGR